MECCEAFAICETSYIRKDLLSKCAYCLHILVISTSCAFVVIIHASDVVRWRGYCNHFVTMYVSIVGVYASMIKRKAVIRMT